MVGEQLRRRREILACEDKEAINLQVLGFRDGSHGGEIVESDAIDRVVRREVIKF